MPEERLETRLRPAEGSGLLTDLYQLVMAQAYFKSGMHATAVFEVFVRRLPRCRNFLLAAGLTQIVEYLETLRFTPADLDFLAGTGQFDQDFLDHLACVRFTGSLHAMPEGTPFFDNEPFVRVTAPILEAQLVESRVLNLAHFQTLIASKAVRCVVAAQGKKLVDFGMRRAHGAEAAVLAARATYIAGFNATATVQAGRNFGIPLSGTMAHSFVETHDREVDAFRTFISSGGRQATVLIDTYDSERAAHRLAALSRELSALDVPGTVAAVRIDSGDLATQAARVRQILDAEGRDDVQIVLSGGLDEHQIESLLASGTPVDAFGVGTSVDVSADAPALDIAYKLVEYDSRPRRKRSPGKQTWPSAKQVFRGFNSAGLMSGDCIGLADEAVPGQPLLREFMRHGLRVSPMPELSAIRSYCRGRIAELPAFLLGMKEYDFAFDVRISAGLQDLGAQLDRMGD